MQQVVMFTVTCSSQWRRHKPPLIFSPVTSGLWKTQKRLFFFFLIKSLQGGQLMYIIWPHVSLLPSNDSCCYSTEFHFIFVLTWALLYLLVLQRAARCIDPSPCLHPPCTREVWALTAAPLMASHPIATASPATPILSWAPQHPATTWTLSATGSPRRSVLPPQCICARYAFTSFSLLPPLLHFLPSLFRTCNCIWLKLKFRNSMFSKITASVGFYVRLPKPWIYFSYSKLLHL